MQLAQILTRYLPRSHPAFPATRDVLITLLAKAQNQVLVELCAELKTTRAYDPPLVLSDLYLERCLTRKPLI